MNRKRFKNRGFVILEGNKRLLFVNVVVNMAVTGGFESKCNTCEAVTWALFILFFFQIF